MRSDLHVHTSCSDGAESPEKVVSMAVDANVDVLAICDHDTMEGYHRARAFIQDDKDISARLTLVPGMEVTTAFEGHDVHMLAYFIDELSDEFADELERAKVRRSTRALRIAEKLKAAGFHIDATELLDSGETVNRVNVARALVSAGDVSSVGEAFATLIGEGCPYYVDREDIPSDRAIELIRASGGIPVLAHPAHYHVEYLIEAFAICGLRGIEAYHSEQSEDDAARLVQTAARLGLLVTGGSDSHEDDIHPGGIGDVQIGEEHLSAFLAADPRKR